MTVSCPSIIICIGRPSIFFSGPPHQPLSRIVFAPYITRDDTEWRIIGNSLHIPTKYIPKIHRIVQEGSRTQTWTSGLVVSSMDGGSSGTSSGFQVDCWSSESSLSRPLIRSSANQQWSNPNFPCSDDPNRPILSVFRRIRIKNPSNSIIPLIGSEALLVIGSTSVSA